MMILEWFQLSMVELILLASLLLTFFVQLYFYLYYYRGVIRESHRISKGKITLGTAKPPVSIIICAKDQALSLEKNLPAILEQDYPEFQVVVVNDASQDDTEDTLIRLEQSYPHLYHTFVPEGVQNVSTRKMAMTIGIKAAKYDILLLTEANCVPKSNQWISSMARHFTEGCDIVLAFSSYPKIKGFLKHLVSYDNMFTALQFMGFSEAGKPYMGFGRNMAYRKDLFFKNRGFASHLNLKSGEDDLFIGEIANSGNTSIDVSSESIVCAETSDVWNHWKEQKMNRIATSSYYSAGTRFRIGVESLSRFLFYGLFIVLLVLGIIELNIALIAIAVGLIVIRYVLQLNVVNKSAKCLDEHRFCLSVPFFDVLLPIVGFWFRVIRAFHKENSYTWRVLH